MIEIQQLTSLISAFRVETEKESISPETVGYILQAIDGKASLESFILQPIRENICISLAAYDIIIIYLCQNITEL